MSWTCNICSSGQPAAATYCSICNFSKPMDRKGIPQIFAGYSIHFNGIIPRTLIHPSHAVEWRMAERHGAVCTTEFDSTVNLVVYRVGYERSDKCRQCVSSGGTVMAVPIRWMLDSLLETRQIHPSIYQLKFIPEVANPAGTGVDLVHYQHPYFLLKAREYGIPTSFPPTLMDALNKGCVARPGNASASSLVALHDMKAGDGSGSVPPMFEIPPVSHSVLDIFDSALATLKGRHGPDANKEFIGERKERSGLEIVSSQLGRSKVDKMLFSGIVFVLSPSLSEKNTMREVLAFCGAKMLLPGPSLVSSLRGSVTHVLYHYDDKKSDFLIHAAHIKRTERPGLVLCESSWVEDCLLLGELIPVMCMYAPSDKLMDTLKKKYEKLPPTQKA